MRMAMGIVGVVLSIGARANAAPAVAVVSGGGAIAEFEALSSDGCTRTVGELVVVHATRGGDLASGVYVVGSQDDLCNGGFGNGFAGVAPASFAVSGLGGAHVSGSFVVPSYSGGADVAIALDLAWTGTGAVSASGGAFHDGASIAIQWGRSRAATTAGTFDVDGAPATVTGATLVSETSGSITF